MRNRRGRAGWLALAVSLCTLAVPAGASAWEVKVYTYGAGLIDEVTPRNLMYCLTPLATPEASETTCTAGTTDGLYAHGDLVELHATVPSHYYTHGWRFSHWDDGTTEGRIKCEDGTPSNVCKFRTWGNVWARAMFSDDTSPDTSLGSGGPVAGQPTNQTSASFTFDSPDPSANFQCQLTKPSGSSGWYLCGSPSDEAESYSGLTANGSYTFRVRAVDPSGNQDMSEASRTWTVDTEAPTTTITSGPAPGSVESSTSASFAFSGGDGATAFECRLDGGAVHACISPTTYHGLGQGPHAFHVRARDAAGNWSPWITRTWTVDTAAPETGAIGGFPAHGESTTETSAQFTFTSADDPGATFECSLDEAAWAACTSPHNLAALAPGVHTFRVRAVDAAGNRDDTPTARTWTVIASDADGDGSLRSNDCDDGNAAIHPGATDTPGNGIDEDCSGTDAAVPPPPPPPPPPAGGGEVVTVLPPGRVISHVRVKWRHTRRGSLVRSLLVTSVPAGGKVAVRCKGRGCPFTAKSFQPRAGKVSLRSKRFRRALARGAVLEVRVTAADMIGKVVRYKVGRRSAKSRTLCLAPGASVPRAC